MSIRCKSCGKDIPLESVKNMNSDNINIRQVELDEFKKGILSGEIKPHDVDIIIRYKDGKEKKATISWQLIVDIYKYHNLSAVDQMYQHIEGYSHWHNHNNY